MRANVVWALVALNAILLACLVGQWLKPNTAQAQVQQAPRPSDYVLIPGTVQGNATQVIYMIDTQNGWLSARTFDGKKMTDMRPLSLTRVFASNVGAVPPRKGGGVR